MRVFNRGPADGPSTATTAPVAIDPRDVRDARRNLLGGRPDYDRPVANDVIPDPATAFGERVRRRLTDETAIWLTTVGRDGTPQPNPVGFLWDGRDGLLIYSQANARRLANIRRRPQVSLNLDSHGGEDVVVLNGV